MNRTLTIAQVPCDQIRLGDRHRKDLGDLEVLAASISSVGLLHPPVVSKDGLLVCGERRFRAMRDILGWKTIPVIELEVSSIVEGEYAADVHPNDAPRFWAQAQALTGFATDGE
ncbi:MAG: ParB N-terminal domain-containing protein, partial [Bryobacteraceae bacterium]